MRLTFGWCLGWRPGRGRYGVLAHSVLTAVCIQQVQVLAFSSVGPAILSYRKPRRRLAHCGNRELRTCGKDPPQDGVMMQRCGLSSEHCCGLPYAAAGARTGLC